MKKLLLGVAFVAVVLSGTAAEKKSCNACAGDSIAKWDPAMAANGAVVDTNGVKWIDGRYLPIEGRWNLGEAKNFYSRLPDTLTTNVNGGVRGMRVHTSGMLFRFRTDSKFLVIRMKPLNGWHAMPHMTEVGTSGWDVYRFDEAAKKWRFVASNHISSDVPGRPGWRQKRIPWKPGDACIINLPLYNGVAAFELGIDPLAKIEALAPRTSDVDKPVVFYGTSITHGGCATRPGLGFVNMVGRDLDVPVFGLGFSGSGVMEYELSDVIARIDASCYVLDCLWNMGSVKASNIPGRNVEENYEPFIRNLRAKRPDVPIVMAEACDVFCGTDAGRARLVAKNNFIRGLYEKLVAEGWKNLYYLPQDGMLGDDFEGTVDGCHPNDLGMKSMSVAFGKAVREALAHASPASAGSVFAGGIDNAVLHGETDKARAIDYAPGEEMVFTLKLVGAEALPEKPYFLRWHRTGDDGKDESGRLPLTLDPMVLRTKLDQPGFVRIRASVVDENGVVYKKAYTGDTLTPEGKKAMNAFEKSDRRIAFDGGAGVKVETLQSVPEPTDFDAFWAKRKARLAKVPMTPVVRKEHKSSNPAVRCFTFSVPCAGPRPVTGTLTIPKDASRKYPATIRFHGYGKHFVQVPPSSGPLDRIDMFINAHGYELEREPEYYDEFYNSIKSNGHSFGLDPKWQNESTETAYFGWMIYRIMRAIDYLASLPEWDGKEILAEGGSMGGLQAMWAAGIDSRVTIARPCVPWCCDMGGRTTLKRDKPDWGVAETEAIRYFDPVNFAKRVGPQCFVEITRAGLGDYVCPPSGIAVLYNNLKCPKKINWVQGSTHGFVPKEPGVQKFSMEEK